MAQVCQDWEAAASHSPVPTATLRTGHVLAKEGGYLAAIWKIFALGLGGRVADGRQFLSWISLTDHLRAMEFLLGSDLEGPVNLVGPHPVTNTEFTHTFGRYLNRPTLVPMPLPAVSALYGRDFVRETLMSSQRVLPARLNGADFSFEHHSLAEALAALG